jgi:peptide/nickel transport system substrate-binding protein
MHRRFWFATVVMALAASLLASSAIAAPSAKKGGTLKGMFATDADFIDPSLAYFVHSWQIMGATGANLLRFADAEGSAGSRLVPELATGFPKVSNSGKTYTFTIRKGWKFSDNKTPVSAASFAWAFNRALNSQQQSPAAPFVADIVGAQAVIDGKARSASGITARGNTLTIRLTKVAPDFLTRIAMPFFQAMDPKLHPIDAKGLKAPVHAAGPYYVATWTPNSRLTMKRNPGYKGNRAANVNAIEYDANVNLDAQVLRIKAGQADFAAEGISPSAHADLAKQYGINRKNGQYQVRQVPTTYYLAMNTTKGITTNANVRKAVNYAIDRQAMLAQRGYLAGKRADQILPPGIPGFRDYNIYPMKFTNANLNKAKSLMGSRSGKFLLLSGNRGASLTIPQIVKFNLGKIGLDVDVQNLAGEGRLAERGLPGDPDRLACRLSGSEQLHRHPAERQQHPRVEQQQLRLPERPGAQSQDGDGRVAHGCQAVLGVLGSGPGHLEELRAVGDVLLREQPGLHLVPDGVLLVPSDVGLQPRDGLHEVGPSRARQNDGAPAHRGRRSSFRHPFPRSIVR